VKSLKDAPETPGDFDMILQNAEGKKQIYFSNPEVEQNNAILEELKLCRCDKYEFDLP
jgi:hypothetical protein